jgi:rhodanese-related sulfurtransferase
VAVLVSRNVWPGGGYFGSPAAIRALQDSHCEQFLPTVNAAAVQRLIDSHEATIVDARLSSDFFAGHLDGAIHIPVNGDMEQCRKALAGIEPGQRILVYCHSNGCPYSGIVALRLMELGYSNIVLFRDGWVGWQKYQRGS